MSFTIKVVKKAANKPQKASKRVEDGITYSKWMYFPDCLSCGLTDPGKDAGQRPDEIHHLNCTKRRLMDLPLVQTPVDFKDGKLVFENLPRKGTFKGEALQRQLRYPFRKILRLPGRNSVTKALTGEFFFFCEYYFKTEIVVDWVWTGDKWLPWFEFSGGTKPVDRKEITDSEKSWSSMFLRNQKPTKP